MKVPAIAVLTVSWRSAAFLRNLYANLLALADHPEALRLLVADNTGGDDSELYVMDFPALTVVPVEVQGQRMSMAHAAGLTALLAQLDAAVPFVLIVDPDIAILRQGWDTILRRALEAPDIAAVGAPYPPWKIGKYHDFPSPPFAFWRTDRLRSLRPDWRPYARTTSRRLLDFFLRQVFWLPKLLDRLVLRLPRREFRVARWMERLTGVVSKDTGWEIAAHARRRGWRADCFDVLYRPAHALLFPASHAEAYRALATEFELYGWEGQPFVTHRNPTRTRISLNLWTNHNILLYQDRVDTAAQTARWHELVTAALTPDREL